MDTQKADQAKDLLKNFNRVDESVQDKLLNGVKCLAFLYDLKDTDGTDKVSSPVPAV